MLNPNVGAEIGLSYLMGGKSLYTQETVNPTSSSLQEDSWKASMIRIVPAIRMTAGTGKMRPYTRIGLIVGVGAKAVNESKDKNTNPSLVTETVETWEYKGGLALGFHGGLGILFAMSDKLGIFAELAGNYQSWAPKKSSMTVNTIDGTDHLSDYTTSEKEVEYVKTDTYSSTSPATPGEADKQTRFHMPFSSFGINVGVHITMGGGAAASK